ncbi:guanine nucleotide-binding protein g(o) subunit alpha [Anaeramoeba flamelloides]|uniref:Guanine nucleotide-binding protein g(O) subunit alpha n=1 Tax=Anaeramoeba flamelloides TaxID=1746091 RepID=A0ABQ8Y4R6_9EUKA|nr:guanine nucleotide-binding protein g(o) subunit alpha [Anaeramoeba flamelloides]
MGNNTTKKRTLRKERMRNKRIERQIGDQKTDSKIEFKILVIGCGDSGKSTLVKQMKVLFQDGFSEEVLQLYKMSIRKKTLIEMKTLIKQCKSLGINLSNLSSLESSNQFLNNMKTDNKQLTKANADLIQELWSDRGIKTTWKNRNEFQISENMDHFFDKVNEISKKNYRPTTEDILLFRIPTTGISETSFKAHNFNWKVIDVGGQRSERRKWIHHFDNVSTVLFVVAMNEFNKKLFEDQSMNRMHESLAVCETVLNNDFFKKTDCVLLFNKVDLFKESLRKTQFGKHFTKFKGQNNFEDVSLFIKKNFFSTIKRQKKRKVDSHFVKATDTISVEEMINSVISGIIETQPNFQI